MTHNNAEAQYDHYDDLAQHNAAEIREMTGIESPDNSYFSAEAIQARLAKNEKGGLNHAAWAAEKADPTQAAKIQAGIELCREALKHDNEE